MAMSLGRTAAFRPSSTVAGARISQATVAPRRLAPLRPRQRQQQRTVVVQGLFGLGVPELVVIAGVAALIFGPSKLPELGKGLGKTVKSFQTAAKEFETELKQAAGGDDKAAAAAAPKDGAAAPGSSEASGDKKL